MSILDGLYVGIGLVLSDLMMAISAFLIFVFCICLWSLYKLLDVEIRYRQSRNIEPAKGQTWIQDDNTLYISHECGDYIHIKSGAMSWSESKAEFARRKQTRKRYLKSR
jgi:hypothetical protein